MRSYCLRQIFCHVLIDLIVVRCIPSVTCVARTEKHTPHCSIRSSVTRHKKNPRGWNFKRKCFVLKILKILPGVCRGLLHFTQKLSQICSNSGLGIPSKLSCCLTVDLLDCLHRYIQWYQPFKHWQSMTSFSDYLCNGVVTADIYQLLCLDAPTAEVWAVQQKYRKQSKLPNHMNKTITHSSDPDTIFLAVLIAW